MSTANLVSYLKTDYVTNEQSATSNFSSGWLSSVDEGRYLIDGSVTACKADSLAIDLVAGDYVGYLKTDEGNFIVSLLKAVPRKHITISYPCADRLKLVANHIELLGKNTIALRSLQELSLETCRNIKFACQDLFQTASGSVVNIMTNWVQQCDQGSVQAKDLLRTDAGNQIITASRDMRLDAERINMG